MQNLVSGAVNKITSLPIWNAKFLQTYSIPKTSLDGAVLIFNNASYTLNPLPIINYGIEGLTLSNGATTETHLNIAPGSCMNSIGFISLMTLASTLTKRLDQSWVSGNNLGGRFTGVSLSDTTYHVFLIRNLLTGVVDVGFDTSVIAANRPSGWNARRIGSILRISNSIFRFIQSGTFFLHREVRIDLNGVAIPQTNTLYSMTVPLGIPVIVNGILSPGLAAYTTFQSIEMKSPNQTGTQPAGSPSLASFRGTTGSYYWVSGVDASLDSPVCSTRTLTNTSAQVSFRTTGSYLEPIYQTTFQNHGWDDVELLRGK